MSEETSIQKTKHLNNKAMLILVMAVIGLSIILAYFFAPKFMNIKEAKEKTQPHIEYQFPKETSQKDKLNSLKPAGKVCEAVITPAKNPKTGEVRNFPTSCSVPNDWHHKTKPTLKPCEKTFFNQNTAGLMPTQRVNTCK